MNIEDLVLEMTCESFPESYNVYHVVNNLRTYIGFLELNNGCFSVNLKVDSNEHKTVRLYYPEGQGSFTQQERGKYLLKAKNKVIKNSL